MSAYAQLKAALAANPRTWLVTGVAGFIGSHLLEQLLKLEQPVVGLDDFATGRAENLEEVRTLVSPAQWARFRMIRGDICDPAVCAQACASIDFVLHQAALASVPQSLADPIRCHQANVTGFLNLLVAARDARVRRLVFASSCALYGNDPDLPKTESRPGPPLSPYAATKAIDEVYADVFGRAYGLESIGLRYFNVFGPRQDPKGAYAAVLPQWVAALLKGEPVYINGDGETTRDFCYVENVVQANLLAAAAQKPEAINQVYNVAIGERISLNRMFAALQANLRGANPSVTQQKPVYREFRPGDVRHSQADISKAQRLLGYAPAVGFDEGLELAIDYYRRQQS